MKFICLNLRLTRRRSILVLLSSTILLVMLVNMNMLQKSGMKFNGDYEKDETINERSSIQRKQQVLRTAANSKISYQSRKENIKFVDEYEDYLERDLHLCNLTAFTYREGASEQHKEVYTWLRALDDFIPKRYLDNYDNPCWYSALQPSPEISSKLLSTIVCPTPLLSLKQAESVVERVFSEASRKKEVLTCLPAVYLAGIAKSGTTTLYDHLFTHPMLRKPASKEGQFWRSFLTIPMNYTHKQIQVMWYLERFSKAAQYIESHPNTLTVDGSGTTMNSGNPLFGQSYYYDARNRRYEVQASNSDQYVNTQDLCFIPMAVHSVLPDAKFVVIMRNPVKRLFSDYWFFCATKNGWPRHSGKNIPKRYMDNAPQIFHNITVMAIQEYNRCANDPTLGNKVLTEFTCLKKATLGYDEKNGCYPLRLGVGMYYYHIVKWMNVYPRENFHFLRLEDMSTDTYNSVAKIWEFMGLSPISKATFESKTSKGVLNQMNWIKEPGFKERFYMLPETEKLLYSFYEPFNKKLAQLLGNDDYLWITR